MVKNRKLVVSRYTHSKGKKQKLDDYTYKLIAITAVICIILGATSIIMASMLPKGAFKQVFKGKTKKAELASYIYPAPDEDTRIKADRLREIRYEDFVANSYTPLEGEMDNVYLYDTVKKCYLTFDDGPSNITPQILEVLDWYGVKATFFVQGQNVDKYPDIIKDIYNRGHTIGNHTYSHNYNTVYGETKESFLEEVTACKDAIDKALGKEYEHRIFRFPGGYTSLTNESTKKLYRESLMEIGYKYIDWSCLTGDSNRSNPTSEYLMNTLKFSVSNTKTGDIVVLMHDASTKQVTADTLSTVIEYLYGRGFKFDSLENIVK